MVPTIQGEFLSRFRTGSGSDRILINFSLDILNIRGFRVGSCRPGQPTYEAVTQMADDK